MRDVISGRVFEHKKRMNEDFIKSRIVRGGSGKVEQTIRSAGWDPLTPSAAVSEYVLDTGKLTPRLFLRLMTNSPNLHQ